MGSTGARFGGQSQDERLEPLVEFPHPAAEPWEPPVDDAEPAVRSVRPYVLTGGRTRAQLDLALETLVSAVNTGMPLHRLEHETVVDLCARPRSVAEIAAMMKVPIGVAKVLVGDLAANGTVVVHATSAATGPDLALMERVLAGLRNL